MAERWIAKAVERPGALTHKAEAAGMGVQEYAQAHKEDSGRTGKQARLAITFKRMASRRKRGFAGMAEAAGGR